MAGSFWVSGVGIVPVLVLLPGKGGGDCTSLLPLFDLMVHISVYLIGGIPNHFWVPHGAACTVVFLVEVTAAVGDSRPLQMSKGARCGMLEAAIGVFPGWSGRWEEPPFHLWWLSTSQHLIRVYTIYILQDVV